MKKRILSIILAIAMLACMIPLGMVTVFAETAEVKYMDWDDSSKTLVEKTATAEKMTSSTASLANGGWYVVDGTVTVNNRIALASSGTAHIILKDGAKLTASAGIEVDAGQSLYIYGQADGTGTLEATGANFDAGIGGSESTAAGTVIINGGTVTATGGSSSAGIGSAHIGSGGTVIINGGTVTATGTDNSAGIGNGYDAEGATVTINGGTVTATGGEQGAAGIGGCLWGDGATVTINGGTITAIGANGDQGIGAGIGGGAEGNGGTVTINGGTVIAISSDGGAGIGGGSDCDDHGELSVNSALTIIAGDDESSAEKTTLDDYKSDRNPYIKVVKLAPIQRTVTLTNFVYDNSDTISYIVGQLSTYQLVAPDKTGYRFNRFELSDEIPFVDMDNDTGFLSIGEEVDCDFSVTAIYDEVVAVPEGIAIKYDGEEQTGVAEGTGYTLTGTTKATAVGKYTATATLEEGYCWSDGSTEDKTIEWEIVTREKYNLINENCDTDGLMARQGKIIDGEVSDTVGRTIIPLTQDQIDSIGDCIWVVGFDGNKDFKVKVDCAYTWFYNVVGNETVKIEAGVTQGLENYAAFIIIDNDGTQNEDKTITGFGYYRMYKDTVEERNFMLDTLYVVPETKAD